MKFAEVVEEMSKEFGAVFDMNAQEVRKDIDEFKNVFENNIIDRFKNGNREDKIKI